MVIIMKSRENDFEDIEPIEFYKLANELNEIKKDLNSTNASINRTIYMRIYYAVFLFLREWMKKFTDYQSWPKGEHKRLAKYIRFHGPFDNETNEIIYRKLIRLKKLRNQSDYKLEVPEKNSPKYNRWDFTSINEAFQIAEDIVIPFKGLQTN